MTANPQKPPATTREGSPKSWGKGVSRRRSGWNPTAANSDHEKPRTRRDANADALHTSMSHGDTRTAATSPPPRSAPVPRRRAGEGPRRAYAKERRRASAARAGSPPRTRSAAASDGKRGRPARRRGRSRRPARAGDREEEPRRPRERRGGVQERGRREHEARKAPREGADERRFLRAPLRAQEQERAEEPEAEVEEKLDAEPPGRGRERVGEDEVRVPVVRLPEGRRRVELRGAERRREGAGGTLSRADVAVRGRGRARQEVAVRQERCGGEEERRRVSGPRREAPRAHAKRGSFRQPHLFILNRAMTHRIDRP